MSCYERLDALINDDMVLKAFQGQVDWFLEENDFGEPLKKWDDSSEDEKEAIKEALVLMGVLNKEDLAIQCIDEELTQILKAYVNTTEFTDYITELIDTILNENVTV
jgi:hypothetical protein